MGKETFQLETETGTIECEAILKFYLEEYKKSYIVYTDHTTDEEGEEILYISSYSTENNSIELVDIKDEKELENIIKQLENYWEE